MIWKTLLESSIDKKQLKATALLFVENEEDLYDAIKKISVHLREQILSLTSIIDICAKCLTLINRIEAKNKILLKKSSNILCKIIIMM